MGKFVVTEAVGGYKFSLKAANGEVIATSEVYTSKQACLHGIESVKKNCNVDTEDLTVSSAEALKHPKYVIFNDKAGEFRFHLKASNGEIIAASEGYTAKVNCKNGIESIKKNAPDAEIVDG